MTSEAPGIRDAPSYWLAAPPRPDGWTPVVTVLINNFNYERFVATAVESALAQTHPAVQVVVVDDGSTDASRAVLARYDGRATVLLQENGGQAEAIAAGLAVAEGELVVVLDSDDVLDPDVVERVVAEFAADPHCVHVQWRMDVVDDEGTPTGATMPPRRVTLRTGDLGPWVARRRRFHPPPTSGNAYRTDVVARLPRTPHVVRRHVDNWWSELSTMLGTVRALEGTGGQYRVHPSNQSVRIGRGLTYFEIRLELVELAHRAGARLAADVGYAGYPASPAAPRDHVYAVALVVVHKLGGRPLPTTVATVRAVVRAAVLVALQPDLALRTRVARGAWVLLLGLVPRGSARAERMVRDRYEP